MIKEEQECKNCKYNKPIYDSKYGIRHICKVIKKIAIDFGKFNDLIENEKQDERCRICGNLQLLFYARDYECFTIGNLNDNSLVNTYNEYYTFELNYENLIKLIWENMQNKDNYEIIIKFIDAMLDYSNEQGLKGNNINE